ncbi:S8/S53 family peptidase [Nonomuraea basaltis]|uniref:S8/S53 family peptidase n=1 Tax=Nonomuraea basaltis TaxID=2495887 RepID=UPI00110C41D3|nr:S8/S53 family peptidase [Nonomuraea basaltis]TMR94510.1 S8/S53 family peptidase [Nonomuraea basaltis]
MDAAFESQYRLMQRSFASKGIEINVAFAPGGDVDYLYRTGRLLTRVRDDNLERLSRLLPGVVRVDEPGWGDLAVLSIEGVERGSLTVPEALNVLDERLGDDNPVRRGRAPLATPDHVVHITRLCPATEPELPSGNPAGPWPAQRPPTANPAPVMIGVADTGLLDGPLPAWLNGVTGDPDALGPILSGGLPRIPPFKGHGTFIAGVARCMAPQAGVYVADHFTMSGGELESAIVARLDDLIQQHNPAVVNLSAGTYTRNNWTSLGFEAFHEAHPGLVLVAAAGNDATDREFYPAAYPWTLSVGALGPDQLHRAWFSNYGSWVDVYALGEGMVNAYATGEYTYQEPPKAPAVQVFGGMSRWDGTSFAAPLVAGMIAAHIARTGVPAEDAKSAVLGQAVMLPGVGPALPV